MKNNLSIHIPTPCHESWDAMTPAPQGRFCQSCAKTVVDFTSMTDIEVLNYFAKATGNTCGRFTGNQLQRPLQPIQQQKPKAWWIAAMMPLLMLFKKAEAQKKDSTENVIKIDQAIMGMGDVVITHSGNATDYWRVPDDGTGAGTEVPAYNKKQHATKITVLRKKGDGRFTVCGKIVERNNDPVPFSTIAIKGSKTAAMADAQGYFSIKGNTTEDHSVLTVNTIGFQDAEIYVQIKDTIEKVAPAKFTVSGKVKDATTGEPVAYASIVTKQYRTAAAANGEGDFSLKIKPTLRNDVLMISAVGYETMEIPIALNDTVTNINLGTLLCQPRKDELTTGVIVTCIKPKKVDTIPTFIRKVFKQDVFKTYPNPAPRGSLVNIEVKKAGTYQIQLFNNIGSLVAARPFEADNNTMQVPFEIPPTLTAGMYYIKLIDTKKKKEYTDKIVVQ